MSHVKVAVFPVAGLGTRFLPATKAVPKELLPLVDRPLIDYAVEEAREAGIEEFVFVRAPGRTLLDRHFAPAPDLEARLRAGGKSALLAALDRCRLPGDRLRFVRQDRPLGLGHAVLLAREAVGRRPFAVLLPDDVVRARPGCLAQMVRAHAGLGGHMVATMEVAPEAVRAYGVLDVAAQAGRIARARGLVEKPEPSAAPSRLAVVGRYILEPGIFDRLAATVAGAGGEIQLTDAIHADAARVPVLGYRFDGERFDCGSVPGHLEATLAFALDRADLPQGFADRLARRLAPPLAGAA